jgi:hypothetical protein
MNVLARPATRAHRTRGPRRLSIAQLLDSLFDERRTLHAMLPQRVPIRVAASAVRPKCRHLRRQPKKGTYRRPPRGPKVVDSACVTDALGGGGVRDVLVRVHAVGASGERGPSNEGRLQLGGSTGCEPPAAPAQLTTNAVGSTVTLTWGAAATASSYVIEAGSIPGSVNLCLVRQGHAVREP